jgi:hypothetical protein
MQRQTKQSPKVRFTPRYAIAPVVDPDLDWLRELILNPVQPGREFGEAGINFRLGDFQENMTLINDRQLGYYLMIGKHDWLSLGDRTKLGEVVCPDDWEASAGLFVPKERAWLAIRDFCETGRRSPQIDWIKPGDVPEGGNY